MLSSLPVILQFFPMLFLPLKNHFKSPTWHFSFYNTIFNCYNNFIFIIPSMKMRRHMIRIIHQDNNPIKITNLWHIHIC